MAQSAAHRMGFVDQNQWSASHKKRQVFCGLAAALLVTPCNSAFAQSSSVSVTGGSVAANTPLEINDGEYPLDALLHNEQGEVKLSFTVDSGGHPVNMRFLSSSGSQFLDLQSSKLATSKWTFKPAEPDGSLELTIGWKLPLSPAPEFNVKMPGAVVDAPPLAQVTTHAITATDYPAASIRSGAFGIVALRYVVQMNGSIESVEIAQSSGIKALDDSALTMVQKRWRFQPIPAEQTHSATVSFYMIPPRTSPRCYPEPVAGEAQVFATAKLVQTNSRPGNTPSPPATVSNPIGRWVFVTERGEVSDVLISTKQGLMRPSEPLRAGFAGTGYPRPGGQGCWYYNPIYFSN